MEISIAVIGGRHLAPADSNGLADPYVKVKALGLRGVTAVCPMTLFPHFPSETTQQFNFASPEDLKATLDKKVAFTVWDKDRVGSDFLGECFLPFKLLSRCDGIAWVTLQAREKNPNIKVSGEILIQWAVTMTAASPWEGFHRLSTGSAEVAEIISSSCGSTRVNLLTSREDVTKDLETIILLLSVAKARDLAAADSNGFSDPYAIIQFNGEEKQSNICKKTLFPSWEDKAEMSIIFPPFQSTLPVDIRLMDKDSAGSDFLGQVVVPLSFFSQPTKAGEIWLKLHPNSTLGSKVTVKGEVLIRYHQTAGSLISVLPMRFEGDERPKEKEEREEEDHHHHDHHENESHDHQQEEHVSNGEVQAEEETTTAVEQEEEEEEEEDGSPLPPPPTPPPVAESQRDLVEDEEHDGHSHHHEDKAAEKEEEHDDHSHHHDHEASHNDAVAAAAAEVEVHNDYNNNNNNTVILNNNNNHSPPPSPPYRAMEEIKLEEKPHGHSHSHGHGHKKEASSRRQVHSSDDDEIEEVHFEKKLQEKRQQQPSMFSCLFSACMSSTQSSD